MAHVLVRPGVHCRRGVLGGVACIMVRVALALAAEPTDTHLDYRIPLYSTMKAIFLLYLALPQTQGATYVYTVHLRPFFATHEQQIDRTIAEVRGRAYRFIQEKARALWTAIIGSLGPGGGITGTGAQNQAAPDVPTTQGSGPTQLLSSLWTSYGPSIIAGGTALLSQTASTLPTSVPAQTKASSRSMFAGSASAADPMERRRQLEAELASLPAHAATSSIPMPSANNPARPTSFTPSSSDSSLRERTMSGKFEEIRGGDVEGYEVDDDFATGEDVRPKNVKNNSWFGGWGATSSKGSYERVKSE